MDTSPPGVAGEEVISGSGELEADEVMMEEVEQEGYSTFTDLTRVVFSDKSCQLAVLA